jgi:hypothetical protein
LGTIQASFFVLKAKLIGEFEAFGKILRLNSQEYAMKNRKAVQKGSGIR